MGWPDKGIREASSGSGQILAASCCSDIHSSSDEILMR
jgi:hypothetical protein